MVFLFIVFPKVEIVGALGAIDGKVSLWGVARPKAKALEAVATSILVSAWTVLQPQWPPTV
jgi:hypothetical protein